MVRQDRRIGDGMADVLPMRIADLPRGSRSGDMFTVQAEGAVRAPYPYPGGDRPSYGHHGHRPRQRNTLTSCMRGPSSPRGAFAWSAYVRDAQGRPFSPCLEYGGRSDPRTRDSRETAISILMLAEKASHKVCGNGIGYKLLYDYYAGEMSWWSFTEPEQSIIRRTSREFARRLREAGYLPGDKGQDKNDAEH